MLTQAANLPETKPEAKDLKLNGVPLRFEIVQFLKPQHQHIINVFSEGKNSCTWLSRDWVR